MGHTRVVVYVDRRLVLGRLAQDSTQLASVGAVVQNDVLNIVIWLLTLVYVTLYFTALGLARCGTYFIGRFTASRAASSRLEI